MFQFNVYSADGKWAFVENKWFGSDLGLSVGDFYKDDESYTRPVHLKRMT